MKAKLLLKQLKAKQLITDEQAKEALKESKKQSKPVGQILIAMNLIDVKDVVNAIREITDRELTKRGI